VRCREKALGPRWPGVSFSAIFGKGGAASVRQSLGQIGRREIRSLDLMPALAALADALPLFARAEEAPS
jgi:hypothetical protein